MVASFGPPATLCLMIEPSINELFGRVGIKWNRYGKEVIPAWVADMDFPPAEVIADELRSFLAVGDWGYVDPDTHQRVLEAGRAWYLDRHGWAPDVGTSRVVLDVMQAVAACIQAFTSPGEGVITTTPVYHPFGFAIDSSDRRSVPAPLTDREDGYRITKGALEDAVDRGGRLLLLCNPHNPTGRVLSAEELRVVADVAVAADLVVVSDEIHADLTYEPNRHIPIAALGSEIAARTVTVSSASKAFNLAAVGCAVAAFGHEDLVRRFDALPTSLMGHPTAMALRASAAAWEQGSGWLEATNQELATNRDRIAAWVSDDRRVGHRSPEATYLAWLDFRPRAWPAEPAEHLLLNAQVALSSGLQFGEEGVGHARLNFATYPSVLEEILERIGRLVAAP